MLAPTPVTIEKRGLVLLVTIANPPVNALSIGGGVVAGIIDAVNMGEGDPSVAVIAIRGSGRDFSCGADIRDFENAPEEVDRLRELFSAISASRKPVAAILHGNVLGGGLELALAAHVRVAAPGSLLGMPEVNLGLLPGGGGTQRLPRLIGVEPALDMMIGGMPVPAERALELGLIDALLENEEALEWAVARLDMRGKGDGESRPAAADEAAIKAWRAQIARRRTLGSAREDVIDCVEAATTLDMEAGLAFERERFSRLLLSDASRGLRHAFFAERKVGRLPVGGQALRPVASLAVVGAGTMGSGIAAALVAAGLSVTLVEAQDAALAAGISRIAAAIDRDVAKGRLTLDQAAARKALVTPATGLDACGTADLVIEAVFEDLEVKRSLFADLDRIAAPSAILATNTSTLDVDAIAQATGRPDRVAGLHFFSPANVMRLVEVVRGGATSDETLAASLALVRRIGKIGVIAGNCDGFIGNRIFEEYLRQAYWLLEEGALPAQVDAALERWGMAMGPCRTMDLAGQDIGWSIRKRRAITQPDRPYSKIPDLLCDMGRFGQKTGAGYYLYPDGRTAQVDPAIDAMIVKHSGEIGVARRAIADEEIIERCLFAMIGEGAKILAEGIAARPLDIDVIYLNGYGFPAERGGPMFHADRIGLAHIMSGMARMKGEREGWAWADNPFIQTLVARGDTFSALNG